MWRPMNASRLMHLPHSAYLPDRSMYSMYSNLFGLSSTAVTLPTFTLNPFTSGTLTSSLAGSPAAALYGSQDSTSTATGSVYPSSLYGHRYHPYLSTAAAAASQISKRIDSSIIHWVETEWWVQWLNFIIVDFNNPDCVLEGVVVRWACEEMGRQHNILNMDWAIRHSTLVHRQSLQCVLTF